MTLEVARGEGLHQYLMSNLKADASTIVAQGFSIECATLSLEEFRIKTQQLCMKIKQQSEMSDVVELGRVYHKLVENCLTCSDGMERVKVIRMIIKELELPEVLLNIAKRLSSSYPKTGNLNMKFLDFRMVYENFSELVKTRKYHKFWSENDQKTPPRVNPVTVAKKYMEKELMKVTTLNRDLKRKLNALQQKHQELLMKTAALEERRKETIKAQIIEVIKEMDKKTYQKLRRSTRHT